MAWHRGRVAKSMHRLSWSCIDESPNCVQIFFSFDGEPNVEAFIDPVRVIPSICSCENIGWILVYGEMFWFWAMEHNFSTFEAIFKILPTRIASPNCFAAASPFEGARQFSILCKLLTTWLHIFTNENCLSKHWIFVWSPSSTSHWFWFLTCSLHLSLALRATATSMRIKEW